MTIEISQRNVFQFFVSLCFVLLSVHVSECSPFQIGNYASTGYGKRSQPRKESTSDPETLYRQWLYSQLSADKGISLTDNSNRNAYGSNPRRRFQEQHQKRDGDYIPSSIVTRNHENDGVMNDVGNILNIPRDSPEEMPLSGNRDIAGFYDLSHYNVPVELPDGAVDYRSSQLLKTLMALRRRERLQRQANLGFQYPNKGYDE